MKPALLLSVILGGMSGVLTLVLLGGGLASPASPGSVIAIGLVTPTGDVGAYIANFAAIIVAAVVSFLVSAVILKSSKKDDGNIEDATKKMEDMKGKKSSVAGHFNQQSNGQLPENVNKIIFACDAGMGSSAMGASLRDSAHSSNLAKISFNK